VAPPPELGGLGDVDARAVARSDPLQWGIHLTSFAAGRRRATTLRARGGPATNWTRASRPATRPPTAQGGSLSTTQPGKSP
jgi:hypothetical protein